MLTTTSTPVLTSPIPTGSVVPAGIPINPVKVGSIISYPPGTPVPVNVGGSIVNVKTVPAPVQSVYQTTSVPIATPATVSVTRTSLNVPVTTTTTSLATSTAPTPTLRTLPPKIIRNQLPPKYNTVTLPAKVVQTKLPPLGPPPTPQLSQIAVSTPITTVKVPKVQQVVVPNKTKISVPVPVPVAVQPLTTSVVPTAVPTSVATSVVQPVASSVVPVAPVQSVVAPIGVGSVRPLASYATTSVRQVPLATTSVTPGLYSAGSVGTPVLRTI